eukprot:1511486-Prymnesium_polylepis.1
MARLDRCATGVPLFITSIWNVGTILRDLLQQQGDGEEDEHPPARERREHAETARSEEHGPLHERVLARQCGVVVVVVALVAPPEAFDGVQHHVRLARFLLGFFSRKSAHCGGHVFR